jgi:hypothetical protein
MLPSGTLPHAGLECLLSLLVPALTQGGYSLTLTLPEGDQYYDDKLDILERHGLGASASFNITRGEDPTPEMMGFLRLMQLQGEGGGCCVDAGAAV